MSPHIDVRHAVCRSNDLAEVGQRFLTEVAGTTIGVFRLSDGLFAIENRCTHQGGPVCEGNLFRRLVAEVLPNGRVREFYASDEKDVIACPWHGWEYDIRTGEVLAEPRRKAQTFPVDVEDGIVYVTVRAVDGGGAVRASPVGVTADVSADGQLSE